MKHLHPRQGQFGKRKEVQNLSYFCNIRTHHWRLLIGTICHGGTLLVTQPRSDGFSPMAVRSFAALFATGVSSKDYNYSKNLMPNRFNCWKPTILDDLDDVIGRCRFRLLGRRRRRRQDHRRRRFDVGRQRRRDVGVRRVVVLVVVVTVKAVVTFVLEFLVKQSYVPICAQLPLSNRLSFSYVNTSQPNCDATSITSTDTKEGRGSGPKTKVL